jgi:hypothetical protein
MSPMAATKRKIDERAHPYLVIAERLEFHLRQVGLHRASPLTRESKRGFDVRGD